MSAARPTDNDRQIDLPLLAACDTKRQADRPHQIDLPLLAACDTKRQVDSGAAP